jgi:hypothetical protein
MKSILTQLLVVSLALVPRLARAQGVYPMPASLLGAPAAPTSFGQHEALASLILVAVTVLLLLAIGKAFDFRERREEERVHLEAQIGDAFLGQAAFARSSVRPIVRIPFWRGSPARVEMVGEVQSTQLEQSALRIAAQAASRVRSDVALENHIVVVQTSSTRAGGAKGESQMAHRLLGAFKTVTAVVGVMTGVSLIKYAILIEHLNFH